MAQCLVIRHAQSEGNAKGILMGSSREVDSPLSDEGVLAARLKGKDLKAVSFLPDMIYCSELNRAKETARLIRDELSMDITIKEIPELNERGFGRYEGKPYAHIVKAFDTYGHNPPTVESADEFVERVLKGLKSIKQPKLSSVLVITHSNPLAVIRCCLYHPSKLHKYWKYEKDDHLKGLSFDY